MENKKDPTKSDIDSNDQSKPQKETAKPETEKGGAQGHEASDASKESPDYPSADRSGESNEAQQLGKPSPSDADNVRVEQAGLPDTYSGEAGRGQ